MTSYAYNGVSVDLTADGAVITAGGEVAARVPVVWREQDPPACRARRALLAAADHAVAPAALSEAAATIRGIIACLSPLRPAWHYRALVRSAAPRRIEVETRHGGGIEYAHVKHAVRVLTELGVSAEAAAAPAGTWLLPDGSAVSWADDDIAAIDPRAEYDWLCVVCGESVARSAESEQRDADLAALERGEPVDLP